MIRLSLILMGLLALLMIAGGIPIGGNAQLAIFDTPIFVALMGFLCALLVAACARYGRGVRQLIFWPAHLGVVLILLGAGLGALFGVRRNIGAPIGTWHILRQLPAYEDQQAVPLGFGMAVSDFAVEHHDPVYQVYVPGTGTSGMRNYVLQGTVAPQRGEDVQVEGYGTIPGHDLWEAGASTWTARLPLTNGWVLQRGPQTPKDYQAELTIEEGKDRTVRSLRVNAPVTVNGWRIYLMSYGMHPRPYVQLLLRRDPGRRLVVAGIWLVIVGTALLCWLGRAAPVREDVSC